MGKFKSTDGTMINYKITGSGEPLIMIHGLNGNLMMFEVNRHQLAKDYQVITYDARGHGRSDHPENYTLDDHIDDCLELLTHLELKKAHFLGYSMGAYVALGLASRYPRNVDKLILVGARAQADVSSYARIMMEHRDEIKHKNKDEVSEILNNYMFYNKEKVNDWMALVAEYNELDTNEKAIASRSVGGFDYRDALPKIPNTTLLITGVHDQFNTPAESEYIANKIPNSHLIKFEHSGHAPLAEEPERFVNELQLFLSH